eukprot:PhF_6_TR15423/c0_g1_i1/m.23922
MLFAIFLLFGCLTLTHAQVGCDPSWYQTDNSWIFNTSTMQWDTRKSDNGITIVTRGNILTDWLLFKMNSSFPNHGLWQLRDLLWFHNVERNGEWSKSFISGKIVQTLSNNSDILYMQYSGAPADNRDFCYVRCKEELPNQGMMMVFRSLSLNDTRCPPVPTGFVRGLMTDCAERIDVDSSTGNIWVTYILQSDTGGDLPKVLSNFANIQVMFNEFTGIHAIVNNSTRRW